MSARGSGWAVRVIVLALVVAGCGGSDGGGDAEQVSAPPTEARAATSEAPGTETPGDGDGDAAGAGGGETYVVRSGDTLSAIATQFDTTVPAIVEANDIADPDVIDVGQELVIP